MFLVRNGARVELNGKDGCDGFVVQRGLNRGFGADVLNGLGDNIAGWFGG